MSNGNKKYHNLAVGWVRQGKDGKDYISAAANGEKAKVKLFAQLEDGTQVSVDSFFVKFKEDKKSERAPDVDFIFSTES
ncbi:MAG TPA: hypothetical protein VIL57_00925 [Bacteroidia bacterium]